MKVYLVWEGAYSDKGVRAVFSSEGLAQEYIDSIDDGYYGHSIAEFDVDSADDGWTRGKLCLLARITESGDVATEKGLFNNWQSREEQSRPEFEFALGEWHIQRLGWYDSEEHAAKVMGEIRARFTALGGEWADDAGLGLV